MRIPRIYTQRDLSIRTTIELESQASHHLNKVLRMKEGASIIVFNGNGAQFEASIVAVKKKQLLITVERQLDCQCESPLYIHLGIAISRGERMDLVMQKATELGASEITPLFSERCEVKLKAERLIKRLDHWRNIIIGACEQSGRCKVPVLNTAQTLDNWIDQTSADLKLVLHHRTDLQLHTQTAADNIALLIGPEGGLSDAEISTAQQQCFHAMSLGPRVLRTETAPLAAIALLQHRWGDM